MVIERFLGSLALAIAACVSLFLLTQQLNLTLPALSRSILFISIVAVGAVFNQTLHTFVVRLIARLKLKKLSALFEKVGMATLLFKEKPVLLLTFLTLSVIEQAFPMLAIYAMVKTLSIDLSFMWVVVSVPIILAIVRLPISIGGFGLQEGACAFVLGFAGASLSQAVALGITGRVLELLATLPGAFWTLEMPQSVR